MAVRPSQLTIVSCHHLNNWWWCLVIVFILTWLHHSWWSTVLIMLLLAIVRWYWKQNRNTRNPCIHYRVYCVNVFDTFFLLHSHFVFTFFLLICFHIFVFTFHCKDKPKLLNVWDCVCCKSEWRFLLSMLIMNIKYWILYKLAWNV